MEATLKDLKLELSGLDDTKSFLAEEQEVAQTRMENFNMFKDGNRDESNTPKEQHNLLKILGAFFRKIKADASLVAAVPMALGRNADERSEFDAMVVIELEKKLEEQMRKIAEKVKENECLTLEKNNILQTSETTSVAAKNTQRKEAEAMLAIKAEQKQCAVTLERKKEAVIEQEFVVKAVESEHNEKILILQAHLDIQSTLIGLLERVTPEPAAELTSTPAVEVTALEDTMEAGPATDQDAAM